MHANTWPAMPDNPESTLVARAINSSLDRHGLRISKNDAGMLAELRSEALRNTQRVEFGTPVIIAIAESIAPSPAISQNSIAYDLAELQDAFYRLRDELPTCVPDMEIVDALRECFDAFGGVEGIESIGADDAMRHSSEYIRTLEAENDSEYRIADDDGRVYTFNPSEWEYNEQANGWDGERWGDDWND